MVDSSTESTRYGKHTTGCTRNKLRLSPKEGPSDSRLNGNLGAITKIFATPRQQEILHRKVDHDKDPSTIDRLAHDGAETNKTVRRAGRVSA